MPHLHIASHDIKLDTLLLKKHQCEGNKSQDRAIRAVFASISADDGADRLSAVLFGVRPPLRVRGWPEPARPELEVFFLFFFSFFFSPSSPLGALILPLPIP